MGELSAKCHRKFFLPCPKLDKNYMAEKRDDTHRKTVNSMVRDATEHGVGFARIGLGNFLNPQEGDEVMKKVNLKDLRLEVASVGHTEPENAFWEAPEEDEAFTIAQ